MQTTVIIIEGNLDYQEIIKLLNKTEEQKFKDPNPEECEKPKHPEDTILIETYAVNGNVPRIIPAKDGRMTDNITWLVQVPIIKNTSQKFRQDLACRRVVEKFGKVTDMESAELHMELYEPVEVPGTMFFNLTTE
jgi:hypothetical protein